jgi:hypothetical protein
MQKAKPEIVSGHLIVDATKKRMKVRGWIIASQKSSASSSTPRKASARNAPAPLAPLRLLAPSVGNMDVYVEAAKLVRPNDKRDRHGLVWPFSRKAGTGLNPANPNHIHCRESLC